MKSKKTSDKSNWKNHWFVGSAAFYIIALLPFLIVGLILTLMGGSFLNLGWDLTSLVAALFMALVIGAVIGVIVFAYRRQQD